MGFITKKTYTNGVSFFFDPDAPEQCYGRIVGALLLNDSARTRPIALLIEGGVDVSAYADRLLDDDFDLKSVLRET